MNKGTLRALLNDFDSAKDTEMGTALSIDFGEKKHSVQFTILKFRRLQEWLHYIAMWCRHYLK